MITPLNGSWGYYADEFVSMQFSIIVVMTIMIEFGILMAYLNYKEDSKVSELNWLPIFACVLIGNLVTAIIGWILLGI